MIIEKGLVVRTEGDYAWVETRQQSACGACSAKSGCGASALESLFQRSSDCLIVTNEAHARVGQQVKLGISEGGLVRMALLVYMTPLAGMLAGGGLMKFFSPQQEMLIVAAAGLGLVAGLLMARRVARRIENNPSYHPVMLSVEGAVPG